MFIIRIFVKLGLIILLAASVLAQGDILKYGESGADFNIIGEFGNRSDGALGGGFGISMKGVIDIGLSIYATQGTIFSPSITLHPLKQDKTGLPFCMSFVYSSVMEDLNSISLENAAFGPVIYSNIRMNKNKILQPSFSMVWQKRNRLGFGFGLSFFLDFSTGETFKIETAHLISKADYTFGISLGILLRQNKSTN